MSDPETREPSIVISDRRHFTAAGERRPEVPDEERETAPPVQIGAPAKTPGPAPGPAAKGKSHGAAPTGKKSSGAIPFPSAPPAAPEPALEPEPPAAAGTEEPTPFLALLESLYASAMIQLGASAPGEIARPEPDFPAARQTIEIMGVLQNKTRGNLTPGESRALEEMLYELRLYYVQLTRAQGQK